MIRILSLAFALGLIGCSAAEQAEQPVADQTSEPSATSRAEIGKTTASAIPIAASSAQCTGDEQPIFACTMKSGKIASVCVVGEGANRFAQYRFGPPGEKPELVWPETASDDTLALKSVPYSGGGEAQISFTRGDTTYVVFSRMIRTNFAAGEPNNPAIEDGIMIVRGGTSLGELRCDGEADPAVDATIAEPLTVPAEDIYPL